MVRKKLACALLIVWAAVFGYLSLSARTEAANADSSKPAGQTQAAPAGQEKTAGEQFKNIQILKDIPASQLFESMQFITAALGVRCDFCHVMGDFSADTKREKQTARKMMVMVNAINAQAFNGRSEVNCATCHQGHQEPRGFPPLAAGYVDVVPEKSEGQMPTADQVLDKYVEALGGKAAIDKITSRESKGTVEVPERGSITFDVLQKANKFYQSQQMPGGAEMMAGYDGTKGWHKTTGEHGRLQIVGGAQLEELQREAELIPALNLKTQYARVVVVGKGKIGDQQVYGVVAFTPGKGGERLFFDVNSGLLVRRFVAPRTPLGPMPSVEDFSDYRAVDGVKVPFTIKQTGTRFTTVEKLTEVKNNVTIDDSKFNPPSQ